ncbi:SpaA isopeptide-forming pilin-related protein [Ruminococcus bicirculans (ex Wegman et al. 2014)]|uniref:MSCRAMM family protein n=1 Tax=Ruminococcus bicirculans (ex Wegman et al. 2014) TaxID=1160721 RepID=UPI00325C1712
MFKKAFNKGGKRVLSFVMAAALAASSLPTLPQFTAEAALGDVGTKPAHMGQASYNILNAFGELNNNGTTYDSLYTGNSGNLDTNVYLTKGDMRSQYTKLYSDGYNFTMDQNFDKQEVKIAGGTGYNPVSSSSIYDLGNGIVVNTQNINGYGGDTTFSSEGRNGKTNYIGTLATKRADGSDCGYAIRLPDNLYNKGKYSKSDFLNKGGVSCKYENVGTYTDPTGNEINIDCLLEVQDYGVSNSYIFTGTQDKSGKTGELRHDFALITESEYGSLTSAQKNVCKKLSDPVYRTMELSDGSVVPAYDAQNTNKCVYGVPAYYYTKATELGLWEKLNTIDKPGNGYNGHDYVRKSDYYSSKYGALLRFTSNKVGVDVEWVDWVKIKYTFYKSGTNQPISVKGQTVFKDIDNSQGVAFLEGSNVIKKVGAWTDQSKQTTKDFLIRRFTFAVNGSPKYIGLFDHQYKTTESGAAYQDAWIGMAWKGSSFDAIYTFCGTRGSSSAKNPAHSRAPMSGGTIQNDLPGDNMSGNLIIRKYVNGSSINSATYKKNVAEIASLIKYKVTDNHNKTFKVSYNSNTGEYTYDKNGSIETDKLEIHKRRSGVYEVKINNLPFPNKFNVTEIVADNEYCIYSKATRVSTAPIASDDWVAGITDTIKNVSYTNVTYPEKKDDGVSATQGSATAYATFDNPVTVRDLEIVKIIKDINGNTSVPTAKVREDLIFTVKNSAGRYLRAVDGVYAGTSATEDADCQFKLGKDGKFTIKDVPRGEYTVNEKSTSDMSSIMKCDATAKITTENEGIYDAEGNVVGIKTNSGTVINDMYYGYVKIQKKTNTNKGLSGIKFVISGTSDAGVKVSTTVTTDKNGVAVSGPILVGTYTITEDKSTIPAGYIDGKTIDKVVVKRGEVADAKSYDYWNYYTEVSLAKVNAARPNIKIDGAVFAVYKDVNGNGTYEADIDTLYKIDSQHSGNLENNGDGKYSLTGLEFGKYLIKEIVAPKSDLFTYKVDKTYYPVTIDKDHLSVQVANNGHNFEEEPEPCKITLSKRIPLDEINGNIWYQHGTPIFVLELEDDIGRVYRHSYAFTKDYVDAHTFTENGKKYVEMSYTWKNMTPGAYTASEVKTSRYSLKNVINVEKGVYDSKGKVVNFTIKSNEEGKATFYNVKNTYKNLSHNSIAVNIFKK